MGGRLLASRISVKSVTLIGGGLFLFFGVLSLYQLFTVEDSF
jgi:putative Ca2+/H+ antiporter (TMEM165/GDT1 family)